jgi:hypothetical protein
VVDVMALLKESSVEPKRCLTCRWLDTRPDDERGKWEEALAQPKTFHGTQVARAMSQVKTTEPTPTAGSIANHRSGHRRESRRER